MISLYHDRARQLLVYKTGEPDRVQQYIREARKINGAYVAVPATLHNAQILRMLHYPIPGMMNAAGYDWPIERGRKPLAHQKLMAEFMVAHPRCFNLSDMGCVAGETLIDTPAGPTPIEKLADCEQAIVRCLTAEGPRYVKIQPPFVKGRDVLYRVTFRSGRSIIVTKRHVFLTCRGWVSCGNLAAGELMPVFDAYPQQSTWEPCHVKFQLNARHWKQIIEDFRGYSETLFYDAPPPKGADIDQSLVPSQGGVLERIRFEWRTDAQGNKHIHTDQPCDDRRSKRRCGAHFDQGEMGAFLSGYATKLNGNQFHIFARYRLSPSRQQAAPEDQELGLCIPICEASAAPFDSVVHITYERTDVYYDMEVPTHANYVAHGLCNHNTMKTLATLWAADFVMQKENCRALIVAPLSILQRVWADALFANFLGRRTARIVYGDGKKRREELSGIADFYIINFDGLAVGATSRKRLELGGFSADLSQRTDIRLAIVDEASAYRDARTERHKFARLLIGRRDYLWQLTGTPTPNDPTDAYGLAKLAGTTRESYTSFHARTMTKVAMWKWVPRAGAYDEARKLLSPAIRFDIRDVWDGPEMTTQQREVELTAEQKKAMAQLKRDLQVTVRSGAPITAVNEAAARQKFLQISLGAVYDQGHDAHEIDAAPRLAELRAVIANAPGKLLCFCPLTSVVNLLYKNLKAEIPCAIVNGETPQRDRSDIFERFQQPESGLRLLIADPGTMAHGLDLWQARTVVWYGPTDRTELYLQANKRAHRPGQQHPVTVVQIVSNSLEREVYRRLESNESLQGLLLQMVREGKL